MANKRLTIIIINYHSEKPLLKLLEKISSPKFVNNRHFQILIINNGTGDKRKFKKIFNFPGVKVITPNKNIGFAAGVNLGITNSKSKYVLLLNPDTYPSNNSIEKLINCLEKNKASVAGGKNISPAGGVQRTFVRRPDIFTILFDYTNLRKLVPGDIFHKKHYYLDQKFPRKTIEVDAVSGSFMLIERKIIKKVGLFDESYFMYLEDIDYCLRVKENGFKVIFCPESVIKHIGGYSSKNKERTNLPAWIDSRKKYTAKHMSPIINLILQPLLSLDTLIIKMMSSSK